MLQSACSVLVAPPPCEAAGSSEAARVRLTRDTSLYTKLLCAPLRSLFGWRSSSGAVFFGQNLAPKSRSSTCRYRLKSPPTLSSSHLRDYNRVDLRPHGMQQERHQVVSLFTATPPFALSGSRGKCLHLDLGPAIQGDDRAVLGHAFDQSCNRSSGPPAPPGLDHVTVPLSRYTTRPTARPLVPLVFDQSRNAIPAAGEHVTRPQFEKLQKGNTYNSFEERNTYPILDS